MENLSTMSTHNLSIPSKSSSFLNLMLPKTDPALKKVCIEREAYYTQKDFQLSVDLKYNVAIFFEKVLDSLHKIDLLKTQFLDSYGINLLEIFDLICPEKEISFEFTSLQTFLQGNKTFIPEKDLVAVIKYCDKDKDGKVSFSDFVQALTPHNRVVQVSRRIIDRTERVSFGPISQKSPSPQNSATIREAISTNISPIMKDSKLTQKAASPRISTSPQRHTESPRIPLLNKSPESPNRQEILRTASPKRFSPQRSPAVLERTSPRRLSPERSPTGSGRASPRKVASPYNKSRVHNSRFDEDYSDRFGSRNRDFFTASYEKLRKYDGLMDSIEKSRLSRSPMSRRSTNFSRLYETRNSPTRNNGQSPQGSPKRQVLSNSILREARDSPTRRYHNEPSFSPVGQSSPSFLRTRETKNSPTRPGSRSKPNSNRNSPTHLPRITEVGNSPAMNTSNSSTYSPTKNRPSNFSNANEVKEPPSDHRRTPSSHSLTKEPSLNSSNISEGRNSTTREKKSDLSEQTMIKTPAEQVLQQEQPVVSKQSGPEVISLKPPHSKTPERNTPNSSEVESFVRNRFGGRDKRNDEEVKAPPQADLSVKTGRLENINKSPQKVIKEGEELAYILKSQIESDRYFENQRTQLAKKTDFNLSDAFRMFDIENNGYVTKSQFQSGLEALDIFASREELYLLMRKLDPKADGIIKINNLQEIIMPSDKQLAETLQKRTSSGRGDITPTKVFAVDTLRAFGEALDSLMKNEVNFEHLRRRLSKKQTISALESFKILDRKKVGYLDSVEFEYFLRDHGIVADQREILNLFSKYDKDQDGRVYYSDFIQEITPKTSENN